MLDLNILIITPRIPYPPYRGDKLKIYNISKHLSRNNSVKVLTFLRNNNQLNDLEKIENLGVKIEAVKLSVIQSLLNIVGAVFSNIPFQVAWFKSNKMKEKINDEISKANYDAVYFHLIRSAQYLDLNKKNEKSLRVLDFTDAVSLYLSRFSKIEKNPLKKLFIKIEEKRVSAYEKIAEKFNTVFICSDIDKEYLKEQGLNANIKILNNGIDIDYFKADNIKFEENRIIFTGNMPYYANYDAAIYFAKKIFPLVLNEIPDSTFYIVGQKPPNRVRMLNSKNIIVTGFVPDIKKEYLKSAVNVAPIRFGAGTLNKVIESIALGVPVVATPQAVGGLPKILKKYVFIANNHEEFAHFVVKILKTPSLRDQLMKEGELVIREMLSWEKIVKNFERDIEEGIINLN